MQLLGYAESDYLRQSGMTIAKQLMVLPGRVIPPPSIEFGDRQLDVRLYRAHQLFDSLISLAPGTQQWDVENGWEALVPPGESQSMGRGSVFAYSELEGCRKFCQGTVACMPEPW